MDIILPMGMSIQNRLESDYGNEQERYYDAEFRIDPENDRIITGVALPYNEETRFGDGAGEMFLPGAFGEVSRLDVLMDVMHERGRPIARTGGGGLELQDSAAHLRFRVEPRNTQEGNDALENVRGKVYRGASVTFVPEEWEYQVKERRFVVKKAELRRIALVDKPQYKNALLDRGEQMDEEQICALVEAEIEKSRAAGQDVDVSAITSAIVANVTTAVQERAEAAAEEKVQAALTERDEAAEAAKAAEAEAQAAQEQADADRMEAEEKAEQRAELLSMLKPLLPENTETRGQSNHALMVLAAGDEIEDVENRSEDYLMAKLEDIVERRANAQHQRVSAPPKPQNNGSQSGALTEPLNPNSVYRELQRAKADRN